jgi:hypothetical protein
MNQLRRAHPLSSVRPSPRDRRWRRARLVGGVLPLAVIASLLVSASALAAPARPQAPAAAAGPATLGRILAGPHAAPLVPSVVATGTYSCGPVVKRPVMLGKIVWSPPYGRSGAGGIGVIRFAFTAKDCLILTGPDKGKSLAAVQVTGEFPIDPNVCPFLPPSPTYIENIKLSYPGVNFGVHILPSFATVEVRGGAYWTFTAGTFGGAGGAATGLVGGSFATAPLPGARASFRPVTIGHQTCAHPGITAMTLAPTSSNNLISF